MTFNNFGRRVHGIRKSRGYTLRMLERDTGISNELLSQIENGRVKSTSAENVRRLADAFGYTMDELWRGVGRLEGK